MRKKSNIVIVLVLVTFVLILVLCVWVLAKFKSNEITLSKDQKNLESASTTIASNRIDTDNEGVYTNYKHRFKFEYPVQIFTTQNQRILNDNKEDDPQQTWTSEQDPNSLVLTTSTGSYEQSQDNTNIYSYDNVLKLKVGQDIGEPEVDYLRRLENPNSELPDAVFYYSETDYSTHDKEVFYTYTLFWKRNDTLMSMKLASNNKNTLEKNYDIFIKIIDSLKFF